jgi:hypothetical protein
MDRVESGKDGDSSETDADSLVGVSIDGTQESESADLTNEGEGVNETQESVAHLNTGTTTEAVIDPGRIQADQGYLSYTPP